MARTRVRVRCPFDADVILDADGIVIDDEKSVYRFTCTGACGTIIEKPLDDGIRELLRGAGVLTIEDIVAAGVASLEDEPAIWRELLKT